MFYEYKCKKCGAIKEATHGMTEKPKIKCTKCKCQMEKVISGGSGFVLKGEGWPGKDIKSRKKSKPKLIRSPKPKTKKEGGNVTHKGEK